jgi:hypothetical protein
MSKRLLIEGVAVERARYVNQAIYQDKRTYYLLDGGLVVCRNGLMLSDLRSRAVDAQIGTDIAQQGFAAEAEVGKERPKVTIYRVLIDVEAEQSLSAALREQHQRIKASGASG